MDIFNELAIIIFLATIMASVSRILKQPLIVGYILAGVLAGPYLLNVLHSTDHIEIFSKIGITVLLFIVGLNLNPKVIKEVGRASLFIGLGQILITTLIGFIIALTLGIDEIAALYIAIALTFSSTIIILKLLSDKGDLHKLYGKIAIGFLLIQDIAAMIVLLVLTSMGDLGNSEILSYAMILIFKGLLLFINIYVITVFTLPKISKFIAGSQELLFLFSLSYGLGLAAVFQILGFSAEIGALSAGVSLSMSPFAFEIGSRLKPLRDFFIVLFFILLGSQMHFENMNELIFPIIIFSIFVLVGNPVIVIILMNLLGFKRRTGFMTGIAIAQISEFSLILATLGFNMKLIDQETLSLITTVGLVTIIGSTYLILYAEKIYPQVEHLLKYLELRKKKINESAKNNDNYELILFGYDRAGTDFLRAFSRLEKPYLVVDYNPESIQKLIDEKIPYRFGDAQDVEFLEELNLSQVKLVVSTIPSFKTNMLLTSRISEINPKTILIILTYDIKEAKTLYAIGATYVVIPQYLGAKYVSNLLSKLDLDLSAFKEEREKHILYLDKRL